MTHTVKVAALRVINSASTSTSEDNVDEIAEDLRTDTRVLTSLEPLLMHPIFDLDSEQKFDDLVDASWSPITPYAHKIERRYPQADRNLAMHIGKPN
jgi:hypothetical protein